MEKVLGIGGVFFHGKDRAALRQWYSENLGIDPTPADYESPCWETESGPTVWEPFDEGTEYFGAASQQWMINFRVRDLDAMMAQLKNNGVEVTFEMDAPNGRFARLTDPEGNPIQLWEPGGVAS
ncbi:MAG: VOC family protein [Pseudomonadota bacterium]